MYQFKRKNYRRSFWPLSMLHCRYTIEISFQNQNYPWQDHSSHTLQNKKNILYQQIRKELRLTTICYLELESWQFLIELQCPPFQLQLKSQLLHNISLSLDKKIMSLNYNYSSLLITRPRTNSISRGLDSNIFCELSNLIYLLSNQHSSRKYQLLFHLIMIHRLLQHYIYQPARA